MDLSPLGRAKQLERLDIGWSKVSDFRPLVSCKNLQTIMLNNGIYSVKSLHGVAKQLKELTLSYCQDAETEELRPMVNLETLCIEGVSLGPMTWMSDLRQLKVAEFTYIKSDNAIPFEQLPSLEKLWVNGASIDIIDGINKSSSLNDCVLANIKGNSPLKFESQSVRSLHVANIIVDVSDTVLNNLEVLMISHDVKIIGVESLLTWPKLKHVLPPSGFLAPELESDLRARNVQVTTDNN
jgi:hypothetical protein